MGFGIDRRARTRKGRGLFRRAPDPREVGDRLGRLIKRMERGAAIRSGWNQDRFVVELTYHPAAPRAKLVLAADGELAVHAETCRLGPGYHAHVLARLERVLDELDYIWTERGPNRSRRCARGSPASSPATAGST